MTPTGPGLSKVVVLQQLFLPTEPPAAFENFQASQAEVG